MVLSEPGRYENALKGISNMSGSDNVLQLNAHVHMTATSLEAIVKNAKALQGQDDDGIYRVDTVKKVNEMISRFLLEKDFESYVKDIRNYTNQ